MPDGVFVRTRYEWLRDLSSKSTLIRDLGVTDDVSDAAYKIEKTDAVNVDAFNFSNSIEHTSAVINTIEQLAENGVSVTTLKKFVVDLTSQNTYGTFSELSAYRFLLNGRHKFEIQAKMSGAEILNPNGSDLDGVIRLPEEIFFDIKGFGFLDHLMQRLCKRLSGDLSANVVAQNSWDESVDLLNCLLGKDYKELLEELRGRKSANRNEILFSVRKPGRAQVTSRVIDPVVAAEKNADYIFRFAKQFTRHKPFFLIFVIHPWFSGSLHVNFNGSLDSFTSEFARQAFCESQSDITMQFGVTRAEVARLLSGVIFINAWEGAATKGVDGPKYRLLLNPNATNKPKYESIAAFSSSYGDDITVTEAVCT